MIKIFNTLTGKKEEFIPIHPGKVTMYACGVTVYDYSHLGHARGAVIFDLIQRYFRRKGFDVKYVRNFTDIDGQDNQPGKGRCDHSCRGGDKYIGKRIRQT